MAGSGTGPRRRDLFVAVSLVVVSFTVYGANLRLIGTGDSMGSRYVPLALWGWGTVSLDPVAELTRDGHAAPYWISTSPSGEYVSTYPILTPLLAAPLYAPAVAYLHSVEWREEAVRGVAKLMEKVSASAIAALSVGILFLALRRRLEPWPAVGLAVAYAFGTSTWAVSSQALWQQGPAAFYVSIGLLIASGVEPGRPASVFGLAAVSALLAANRLPDALLAFSFGLFVLVSSRNARVRWVIVVAGAVTLSAIVAYNLSVHGSLVGGYARLGGSQGFFGRPFFTGLAGMLVSPGRGLLAYSPFLVFLVLRLSRTRERDRFDVLDRCMVLAVVSQLLLYSSTASWRSIHVYGPRMLAGALPILVWLLAPLLSHLRRPGRILFAALVVFSIGVQAIGAFYFPRYYRFEQGDVWMPHRYPPYLQLAHDPMPFDLPGFTRDLWELKPVEIAMAGNAVVEAGRAVVSVDVARARPLPVEVPVDVVVTVVEESPVQRDPKLFGEWIARLPSVDEPTNLRFEIDLLAKDARIWADGLDAPERGVAVGVGLGPASADGFYSLALGVRRPDWPEFRPSRELVRFRREGDRVTGFGFRPLEWPSVTLRASR